SARFYYDPSSRQPTLFSAAKVYPNPSNGRFLFVMDDVRAEKVVLSVSDARGVEIIRRIVSGAAVREVVEIPTSGLYLLKAVVGSETFTRILSVE
ncbi:MAG: T9SS type A sorting domain-containing protein, partial [Bacteroidia bacterium]|nr:T9SS type A sorting domain-containing protein [Bacteroidia bacterium]